MNKIRRCLLASVTLCIIGTCPANAWWENGHRVVARVAAAHLTPAARARVAQILGVPDTPQEIADALAQISTWADETKAQTHTGSWHFIDLAIQDQKSDIPLRCPDQNCAPVRIEQFTAELASGKADERWSELDALRYVVHLIGDIHQPLHTISDADLGGNCERLTEPIDEARSLHAVWDGALVDAIGPDATQLAADLESYIDKLGPETQQELARGDVDDWVWESHQLAIQDVYSKLHIPVEPVDFPASCDEAPTAITDFHPPIDSLYINAMKPVVRDQLVKAGLRLARVLNESL